MSDVSAVILTIGEEHTRRARESVERQSVPVTDTIFVDESVRPFHRALNTGAAGVRTPFFIQVDADMILDVDCVERLRACFAPNVGIVCGYLRDPLVGRLCCVKLFRTACFREAELPDTVSPDTDFEQALAARGWTTVHALRLDLPTDEPHTFGAHEPDYTPAYTHRKYMLAGRRYRYRRDPDGFWHHLSGLASRCHPAARVAQLGLVEGLFIERSDDQLEPFEDSPEGHAADAFLARAGRAGGSLENDALEHRFATVVRSGHAITYETYVRCGRSFRQANDAASYLRNLDFLSRSPHEFAWVAAVGLCRGVGGLALTPAALRSDLARLAEMALPESARAAWSPAIPAHRAARLPGELWGITTHFNPAGYRNKLENLARFAAGVRTQGLKLLVVELAFGDAPFEVPEGLCDQIERRRTDSVLWQKERLLNIGLERLPPDCDKVAWLDGDVLFENPDWVGETASGLESTVVVQPFETACWLREGELTRPPIEAFAYGNVEGRAMPGMAYAMSWAPDRRAALDNYFAHGHTGFAWAARREVLDRHGFYDRQILGNGDFVIAHAMFGDEKYWRGELWQCAKYSPALLADVVAWSRPFHESVGGSVGYVQGRVVHLWHRNQTDRQYSERLDVLKAADFDPRTDLVLDASGCWAWGTDKPELREWSSRYFHARREGERATLGREE